jgi:hypothetical protein
VTEIETLQAEIDVLAGEVQSLEAAQRRLMREWLQLTIASTTAPTLMV